MEIPSNNLNELNIDFINTTKEIYVEDCEEAINKVGSNGKYQKIAFFLLTICYTCSGSFFPNAFIFLEKDPPIYCYKSNQNGNHSEINNLTSTNEYQCTRKEACSYFNKKYKSSFAKEPKFEFIIEEDYYSWTNDFELTCNNTVLLALLTSSFFIGSMISSLFASSYSDYVGRAYLIKISMFIRLFILGLVLIIKHQYVVLLCMFLLGFLNPFHSTIPYILLSEILGKNERDVYLTYMFVIESFSGFLSTLFFMFYQNWILFFILNMIYGLVFLIFSFLLFESPRYLYSKKQYTECKSVLKKIAKINLQNEINIKFRNEDSSLYREYIGGNSMLAASNNIQTSNFANINMFNSFKPKSINSINNQEMLNTSLPFNRKGSNISEIENDGDKKDSIFSIFIYLLLSSYRQYILILPLIWFIDAFAFYGINFMIKYFDVNIYFISCVVFFSETISFIVSNYICEKYGKRNTIIISFGISFFAFFMFYVSNGKFYLLQLIITFAAKFGASVVLNVSSQYTNECFPTYLRGRAVSICSFLGKFGGIIAPFLVELSQKTSIISCICCLSAAFLMLPLENKSNKVQFNDESNSIMKSYSPIKNNRNTLVTFSNMKPESYELSEFSLK